MKYMFRPGDKVKCIQNGSGVTEGEIYTVKKSKGNKHDDLLILEEVKHGKYNRRFDLYVEDKKDEILMPCEKSSAASGWGF